MFEEIRDPKHPLHYLLPPVKARAYSEGEGGKGPCPQSSIE